MRTKRLLLCFFILHSLLGFAQQGTWLWGAEGIGDSYIGYSIASDRQGDCYITGMFENDTIHFGSYTVMNSTITNYPYSSDFDAWLVKYDHKGDVLWATQTFEKNIKLLVNDSPESVCTDSWGNVYLSGNFIDTLFIGGYTLITPNSGPNPQNMYLAKYTSNGILKWVKQAICINDSSFINETHISCDNSGNIYVTGEFWDTVSIGGNVLTSYSLVTNTFLAKYDSNGNVKWVKQSTIHNNPYGSDSYSDATDLNGNIFITGDFQDTVTFGSYKVKSTYLSSDFYITKYDSAGNVLWANQATVPSANSDGTGSSVATDLSGNVYAVGDFLDTIIFNHDTLIGPNNYPYQSCFFLVKYDPNGNLLWAKAANILDGNPWQGWCLSIDNSKHLFLSANGGAGGGANNEIAFGGDTLRMKDTVKFDAPSVIFKLDSNGNALCGSMIPVGGANNGPTSSTCDTSGNYVYIEGMAKSMAVFGNDTVNPLSYPINAIQHGNAFPFVARWEECDSNVLYASVQNSKPISAEVKVYPNPNNGTFTLAMQNVNEPAQVEIYNMLGESICKKALNPTNTAINLTGQPAGVYFYRVVTETGNLVGSGKLIIQK